VYIQHLQIKN